MTERARPLAGSSSVRRLAAVILCASAVMAAAGTAAGQTVLEGSEEIDFDRPEAWAMKHFSALTQMSALAAPRATELGAFDLSLEVDWIPRLDEEQRRVGFYGTKVEDLNKLPVLVRPRARVGLGWRTSLEIGYVPPIELRGVKANLFSAAFDHLLFDGDAWALGVRAFGQIGEIEGDFTCSEEDASIPAGDPGNDFGCQEASSDSSTLDHYGAALVAGYGMGEGRGQLHFALAATYNDLEFQVDALTYGVRDRSLLLTDGWTYSLSAGISWPIGEKIELAGELFYSPLDVRRTPQSAVENDGLLNLRGLLRYRL